MERSARPRTARGARRALTLAAILAIGMLARAETAAPGEKPAPTPAAAGSSVRALKTEPVAGNPTDDDEDDAPAAKLEGDGLPEPFLCEFSWVRKEGAKGFEWVNSGSDYPRIVPPVTKLEILSPPFTRSRSLDGPSWGACAEIDESASLAEINVVLHAHSSKARTVPDADAGRCRWVVSGPLPRGSSRFRIRVGEWSGIEFETTTGERKRFSAHWPESTRTETDGASCRELATQMKKDKAIGHGFKKLKLSDSIPKE